MGGKNFERGGSNYAVALIVVFAGTGCSSSYQPANSPRISLVVRGGGFGLYKDGKAHRMGYLGGGVEEVVQGNPRAEAEAHTGHNLMIGGFVFSMVGLGALTSGIIVGANAVSGSTEQDVSTGLLLGCIAAEVTSLVFTMNAVPHLYDAINIYNDGLSPMMPAGPAPWNPGPYAPQPYAPQPYAPAPPQQYAPQPYAPAPPQQYAPQPYAPAPPQQYAPTPTPDSRR